MEAILHLDILPQPDDNTCGPTCLHSVYNYYGDPISLQQVVREVKMLENGGTLAVLLGSHALSKGYGAAIYTFDLQIFDPTWFQKPFPDMIERLTRQKAVKDDPKLHAATDAYVEFLKAGGKIEFQDLTVSLIRGLLKRKIPIITGLSATYMYGTARELDVDGELFYDDLRGEPSGHFVVLCGYNAADRQALVADPLMPNPISEDAVYQVKLNRLLLSVMLGALTFDANLLVVRPQKKKSGKSRRTGKETRVRTRRH